LKLKIGVFLNKIKMLIRRNEPAVIIDRLTKYFLKQPRFVPGKMPVFGWNLEYVDALSLVSCLDVLFVKKWNDFKAEIDDPVILDCGANIGISVLNYKRLYPKARITAFEADPAIVPVLKRNLANNGAADVNVVDKAVWTKDGKMPFFCEGADGSRIVSPSCDQGKSVEVETVDFTKFVSGPIDLIKIDIEGAENQVIPHLGEKLKLVRNIIVECHVNIGDVRPFAKLLEVLDTAGYFVAINSYGEWRDLVKQPERQQNGFDQYLLVVAWRNGKK
jgi:FkbM family methyltransferase